MHERPVGTLSRTVPARCAQDGVMHRLRKMERTLPPAPRADAAAGSLEV